MEEIVIVTEQAAGVGSTEILRCTANLQEPALSRTARYEVIGPGWYHVRLAAGGQQGQQ